MAATALGAVFLPKRSRSDDHSVNRQEEVNENVLEKFERLVERVTRLETQLELAQAQLSVALDELEDLKKRETYLEGRLHEKDKEVLDLRRKLADKEGQITRLRKRILHLEEVCKRAGINGD